MKKTMALLIAMTMVFSICSFSAMAEGISFEDISNGQLASFITGDLAIPEGATVTSTNEDVIATDGTVTRHLFDDEAVTLTVNGTAFDLVVKSKKINVINAFDFSESKEYLRSADNPTGMILNKKDSSNLGTVMSENGVLKVNMTTEGGRTNLDYNPASDSNGTVKFYEFDIDVSDFTAGGANIAINIYGCTADGTEKQLGNGTDVYSISTSGVTINSGQINNVSGSPITDGKVKIGINTKTGKFYYTDGTGLKSVNLEEGYSSYRISRIRFKNNSKGILTLNLDNFIEYEEVDNFTVVNNLSDAEKVAYFKNIVESNPINNGELVANADLDLDAAYAEMNIADYGVSVEWASSNTDAIANDGTLVNDAASSYVTMTATITAGAESDTVEFVVKSSQIDSVNMDKLPTTVAKAQAMSSEDFENGASWWTHANASVTTDEDSAHGKVLTLVSEADSSKSAGYSGADYGNISPRPTDAFDQRYFINADVKPANYSAFVIYGGCGEVATEVWFNFETRKIELLTTRTVMSVSGGGALRTETVRVYYDIPEGIESGEWVSLSIDYNVRSKTYNVYVDGQLINDLPLLKANNLEAYHSTGNRTPVRGIGLKASGEASVSVDNLDIRRTTNMDKMAVNASLNAALINYASENTYSSLGSVEFMAKTINDATNDESTLKYNYDTSDIVNNPGLYYYDAENGPSLTYKVNGDAVTSYTADKIGEIELTITATYNGVTESKTVTRKVAPVSVNCRYASANALNGIQVTGIKEGDKILLGSYNAKGQMVNADIVPFSDVKSDGTCAVQRINPPGVNTVANFKIIVVDKNLAPVAHMLMVD